MAARGLRPGLTPRPGARPGVGSGCGGSGGAAPVLAAPRRAARVACVARAGRAPLAAPPPLRRAAALPGAAPPAARAAVGPPPRRGRGAAPPRAAAPGAPDAAAAAGDDVAPPDLPGMRPGGSYDAAANAAYWSTRPVAVVARGVVIAAELARWGGGRRRAGEGGAALQGALTGPGTPHPNPAAGLAANLVVPSL
jgi:hypothetical protein